MIALDPAIVLRDWPARTTSAPLVLTPRREAGLRELLGFITADPAWSIVRQVAYVLATVRHETAGTFRPIREYRALAGTEHRVRQDRYWRTGYYGRGYVQLTWRLNYERAGEALGLPLVEQPDLLLEPAVSYRVLAQGMREGWFTGRTLGHYITETATDYLKARRIVNGNDQAARIATYAQEFELLLRAARRATVAA